MRTDVQRVADTFQPMQPWIIRQLLGPMAGKLQALSMCSPTPEMVQVAVEAFGNPEPDFSCALQSASFRRRYRKALKKERLPSLKAEAKECKWELFRLLLIDLIDNLRKRGYQPDDTRIPKISELEAEYTTRTEQLINELHSRPEALAEVFPPGKTLGGVRARNALPLLGGNDNYYTHLISLIYEIRRQPDEMELSRRHVSDLIRGLDRRLPPEMCRLVNELKSLQVDEGEAWLSGLVKDGARRKQLVNALLEVLSAEDKILPIIPIIMRYFLIETLPSVPSDEASSHKRLPLDSQIAEQVADGQESIGTWHSTSSSRKPVYKIPTQEEHLDDSERLARFALLAGINIYDLNPKEWDIILDLLNGHVYCRQCGRAYYAFFNSKYVRGKRYEKRRYRCSGSLRLVEPINHCHNKSWSADTLESLVWSQIQRVLDNPQLIIAEIDKQRQDANQLGVLETELQQVERHLKALDREQEQLLQWAIKGFPEETVLAENKKINAKRESLKAQKAELETKIKASQEAAISLPKLERFVELLRQKLATLDFETKRMALDMLNIKVWLDGDSVEITGVIPVMDDVIVTTQS